VREWTAARSLRLMSPEGTGPVSVQPVKFCSACGSAAVTRCIPPGDTHPREVCEDCGTIHYQNPKLVVGCILEWQGRILLCRRSIEPRYGYWTLPAGFMETGESTLQAAAREAWEEANAIGDELTLYALYSLTHISQVYLIFRGRLQGGRAGAGAESLEVALLAEEEIPWQELAFPVISETLRYYFEERRTGCYRLHIGDISRGPDGKVLIKRY
jgi:ADP-ribose pyrophosphatase YjhB (NUDIX family)